MQSYELRRRQLHSERLGITIGLDGLNSDELDVYSGGPALDAYLKRETEEALGEVPDFSAESFSVGRSSEGVVALIAVGIGVYSLIAQAKDFDESIPVIKEWARKLNEWRRRFMTHTHATFTVEALKLLCHRRSGRAVRQRDEAPNRLGDDELGKHARAGRSTSRIWPRLHFYSRHAPRRYAPLLDVHIRRDPSTDRGAWSGAGQPRRRF